MRRSILCCGGQKSRPGGVRIKKIGREVAPGPDLIVATIKAAIVLEHGINAPE
jgi:hypothetical protein